MTWPGGWRPEIRCIIDAGAAKAIISIINIALLTVIFEVQQAWS